MEMHGQISIPFLHHRLSLPEEVVHLYLISAIRTFLSSSAAIFMPLYVFHATNSALMAFAFMFLEFFWLAVVTTAIVYSFRRVTFEWLGLASTVAFAGLFAFVFAYPRVDSTFLLVAPLLFGASGGSYWLFHHLVYSVYGGRHVSRNFSYESIINTLVGVAAPIITGFIAYFLSYHVFFALASVLSVLYLFVWIRHLHKQTDLDLTPLRGFYRVAAADRTLLYFIGGFYTIPFLSIPIYLAADTAANTPAIIGTVMSASALFGAFVTYILGKYVDESHDYPLGALGFTLLAFLILHMLYTPSIAPWLASIRDFFGALAFLPATSWIYLMGGKSKGAELFARELALFAGRIVFFGTLILLKLSVDGVLLFGAYALILYGIYFYYLSRIRYQEV
jgi:MFS family permease